MPPDSDWESDILSSQRPPEGRDVAASSTYMPPLPSSATSPNLLTDGATPSASQTPPLLQDVGAVYVPLPGNFRDEEPQEAQDEPAADEATGNLIPDLERPRETIAQLAALVSDALAANAPLPVNASNR